MIMKTVAFAAAAAVALQGVLLAESITDVVDVKTLTAPAAVREFHGHSDPWAVLGAKMGDRALEKLGVKKKIGVRVLVEYDPKLPSLGIVDGLQLATGATYGREAITAVVSNRLRVRVVNMETGKGVVFRPTESFRNKVYQWKSAGYGCEKKASLVTAMSDAELFTMEGYEDR